MIRRTAATEDEEDDEYHSGDLNLFGGLVGEEEEEVDVSGESFRTLGIDGFVLRKTRYSAWKERYLRTAGPFLYYYSSKLKEIKAARFSDVKTYRYDASGKSPSEVYDLRAPGLTVKVTSKTVFVLILSASKKLEIKTESETELKRWTAVLRKIRALDDSEVKKLGTLTLDLRGAYVIGGTSSCRCKIKVGLEEEVESNSAMAEGRDLAYHNLDGKLDYATAVDDLALSCSLPIYQASTVCHISLEDQDGAIFASRSVPIFELQEERAQATLGFVFGSSGGSSSSNWPALAPDGRAPRPGYKWLALFEEDDSSLPPGDVGDPSSSSSSFALGKVKALLQARMKYSENILNTIDLVKPRDRYEADDDQDLTEFKLDLLSSGMRRLEAFQHEVFDASDVLQSCLDWDRPLVSFCTWFFLVSFVLASPDSATLAIFPLFALVGVVATLPFAHSKGRWQIEGETIYNRAKEETVRREVAEISLSVLAAKDLVAAKDKKSSKKNFYSRTLDPYAVVINDPPNDAFCPSQMLVGITSVKFNTLNPQWALPSRKNGGEVPSNEPGSANRLDRRNVSLDVDDEGEHLMLYRDDENDTMNSEDALKLVFGAGIGDHVLNEVLEKTAGRNAVSVNNNAMRYFGDGAVIKPPIDFASRWKMGSGLPSPDAASWTWPLMQEVDVKNSQPVPWHEAKGHVVVELFDNDLASQDDFLGRCRIPIADLFGGGNRPRGLHRKTNSVLLDEWYSLEPSSSPKKNSAIQGAAPDLGSVRIAVRARVVDSVSNEEARGTSFDGPGGAKKATWSLDSWQHDQAIRRSVLEPEVEVGGREKKSGYVKQYKDVTRSLKSMQDTVLWLATTLERLLALCTWVHPTKTLVVVFGLAAGVAILVLVPNRLVVAASLTKMFLNGLVRKIKARSKSEVRHRMAEYIQLENFIKSFPDSRQRSRAYRVKRSVWASQYRRREAQVQINLHFSFRIRCQMEACIVSRSSSSSFAALSGTFRRQTSSILNVRGGERRAHDAVEATHTDSTVDPELKKWTYVYLAVVDSMVLVWPNVNAAAENKKPLLSCYIAGEPLVGRNKVEPPPNNWPLPPAYLRLVSFASKLPRTNKIKDFYLAIDPSLVKTFVDAVKAEILHAHADDLTLKKQSHRRRKLF